MKDVKLLSELEQKVRKLVSSLEREREKNFPNPLKQFKNLKNFRRLGKKVKNLINLLDQLEQA
ncbi:hypothetical protein Ct9H90mP29_23000 [bacterium]|nr:MAG: hypothetical protein Ct9H90mP29_23000 [bacterium]